MSNKQLTDQDLHCIARHLQNTFVERDSECRYCKYAFLCSEKMHNIKEFPFFKTVRKVEEITGVKIRVHDFASWHKNILAGSWIERCPELLEKFSNLSLKEQEKILSSPDIFSYKDACSVDKQIKSNGDKLRG